MTLGGPDWWRLAVGTLTAWPVAPPRRVNPRVAGRAMLLAPVALLPTLALLGAAAAALHALDAPALLIAALLIAGLQLSCRAMHLDGLADLADGLSASYEADRSLEVMRRGDAGPSGVAALVLVLLLDVAALAALAAHPSGLVLAALAVLSSRQALAWACTRVPAARPGGLGAGVAGSVSIAGAAGASAFLVLAGVAACVATGLPWGAGPLVVACALTVAALVLRRARARLGGLTGDVLGACVECALAAGLVAAVLVAHP